MDASDREPSERNPRICFRQQSIEISSTTWRGFVMNMTMAVGFLMLIVGHVGVATAQDRKFVDKLAASRLQLKIDGERMTGGGADLLRSVLDAAM